ncbi:signal peptidase II [Candidatus Gracilibacteria bacterium]|nr:signal peptidase II [Candidatus Gracilibacteria bacterium]
MYQDRARVSLIGEYVTLRLSHNEGIAFSLPIEGIYLKVLTIFLVVAIFLYYILVEYVKNSRLLDIGYSLIFAGALSHGYERIFKGYVVDFISVEYFAILNFADIFISIGACLLFIAYYVRKQ